MGPANVAMAGVSASGVDMICRLAGPIQLPGGVTPQDYVAKALSDELRLAGRDKGAGPTVTLMGQLTQAGFSSVGGALSHILTAAAHLYGVAEEQLLSPVLGFQEKGVDAGLRRHDERQGPSWMPALRA